MLRVGIGHDTHRLEAGGPLRIGGVEIEHDQHAVGHSDADALLHAVTDALLGGVAQGDIGELFSDRDPANKDRDSAEMLAVALDKVRQDGWTVGNVDCVVFAQRPKLKDHKPAIRARLAEILAVPVESVSVKAKTGEYVGPVGREEAIETVCVALLTKKAA